MLAVNDRQALGNWKVKHVHFMKPDYSGPQPFADHIFRQGEKLFVEVVLERAVEGTSAPAAVDVRLVSTVTDSSGFRIQLPRHHTTADGKLAYYRSPPGEEPSVGPQTNAAACVIGVMATGENVHERTTHDDHDYSDSDAVPYGEERGKGRAAADVSESRGVLPANLEYLQAAGVEFLIVSSTADPRRWDKVPVKNQADLLYFSGHGRVATGRIYNNSCVTWPDHTVSVAEIDPGTNWAQDLDCFTIAACSVLQIYTITGMPVDVHNEDGSITVSTDSPGVEWANRCLIGRTPGGHLKGLCGYYGSAPADSGGVPQQVAAAFTCDNSSGASWAEAWMAANSETHLGVGVKACAMDGSTYWWSKPNLVLLPLPHNDWHVETTAY